ncbi:creatininase family protein [Gracilimonas sediminicola]|uniref:Creatininase family protein n=1 Tax=Gracilimonas sediminicola TaxID=2952158 RepID=A0A9X2REB4_9BACT|nr:creatininase family protein [Gracilimonas sediminicola]MCP9290937.1 creatininase family protein [Gracilimonas sediminicola]
MKKYILVLTGLIMLSSSFLHAQDEPTTREMNLINWMEFAEFVPDKIETVLLPVGTLEPHGVIPNGSDNLAPEAMAKAIAEGVNAMIAPTLNYGVTGSMAGYPGTFAISEESYKGFLGDIIHGMANNKFKNIIILNGHGGPQTAILQSVAGELSQRLRVRILVINWWSVASEDTFAVFGENGGHAGNNETGYVQAIVPDHIHPDRYSGEEMTTPYPSGSTWTAYPFPSSIGLYEEGQGFPTFNQDQAEEYFKRVNQRIGNLIREIIAKWELAGLYE